MKRELLFLGTGCMQPTKQRNHPGLLLNYHDQLLLFDCGEGIQRQLKIAGIKLTKITKIFISHWHGDHALGIPGLLSSIGAESDAPHVAIYGPKGTKKNISYLTSLLGSKQLPQLTVTEVERGTIAEEEDYQIEAQLLKHSARCVGYRFKERDRRRFKPALMKKYNLVSGPLLGQLQKDNQIFFQGKKIRIEEVTDNIPGFHWAYITDTRPCPGVDILAKNVDVLVIESTFKEDLQEKAEEYFHLTTKEAALIANRNNVKRLILTHISQRYQFSKELEEEAQKYFPACRVAEDFMKVQL